MNYINTRGLSPSTRCASDIAKKIQQRFNQNEQIINQFLNIEMDSDTSHETDSEKQQN